MPATIERSENRPDNAASALGIARAPMPKNTPSRLSLAPRSPSLTSAASALVAPFRIPPPNPIAKTHSCTSDGFCASAISSKEEPTRIAAATSIHRYPNRSTIGPNTSEPIRIPNGSSAVSVPIARSSSPNRSANMLLTDPSDKNTMPNSSIPKQAAAKTRFLLYIDAKKSHFTRSRRIATPDKPPHRVPPRLPTAMPQTPPAQTRSAAPSDQPLQRSRSETASPARTRRRRR